MPLSVSKVQTQSQAPELRWLPIHSLSALAALAAISGGLLVLIGWLLDIDILKRVRPGFTAMNPLTAISFVLNGSGIMLLLTNRNRVALMLGGTVAALAVLKIWDLSFGGLPVDRFLFADQLIEPGQPPSRLAPNTAVAILLAGLSLALATGTGRLRALYSQGFGAVVLLIAMFALIGYLFGLDRLHSVGPFIPMAIHTAILLLVLAFGLISLKPDCGVLLALRDKGPTGAMARTAIPLTLLIPIGVGAVHIWGQQQGYYDTEGGVALQVIANVLVTSALLITSIAALHRSDALRQSREETLVRSESQYRLAENVAHVGHWRMDVPSLQVTWSEELFRICGLLPKDGAPPAGRVLKMYHPDDRQIMRKSVRAALRSGTNWDHQVRICRPDGSIRIVSSQGVCERDAHGRIAGLFGVFADVTELEDARRAAEAATTAKAAFLANMSHEIRTPLNGVMGFAELLRTANLPTQQKRHADLIFDSAGALLKLLNDILDVSKIEAGQFQVTAEPFALGHQLRQCAHLMEAAAQKKGLTLTLSIAPDVPEHVLGDGLRMRQVLLNLLGNAVKFTERGSVVIASTISTSPEGKTLQISVADTGVGIAEARQHSVFEEFVQADASISRRFGGSGLGLNISQRLVILMGGRLSLTSVEGHGTCVTMVLPLLIANAPVPEDTALRLTAQPSGLGLSLHNRPRILLVEDLDINQELLTGMLTRMGYLVEIASDGAEAIKLALQLASEPEKYQLIFMDVQMPVVDGLSATRAIRAMGGRAQSIPIIGLTANAYASDVEQCRDAGMNGHLAKPVSMSALGSALTFWLSKRRAASTAASDPTEQPTSVGEKFTLRMKAYAERLTEIQSALLGGGADKPAALLSEARGIAHNLAGSAGMFGHGTIGDLAAELDAGLRQLDELGSEDLTFRIGQLASKLRRAA